MKKKYLISITRDDNKEQSFLSIDEASAGCPYWGSSLSNAKLYDSIDLCAQVLSSNDFKLDYIMFNKTVHPPRMIHSGLGLCNTLTSNSGKIEVMEVILNPIKTIEIKSNLYIKQQWI